jgi:hypothetical protein
MWLVVRVAASNLLRSHRTYPILPEPSNIMFSLCGGGFNVFPASSVSGVLNDFKTHLVNFGSVCRVRGGVGECTIGAPVFAHYARGQSSVLLI